MIKVKFLLFSFFCIAVIRSEYNLKKKSYKQGLIRPSCFNNSKIIFTLLAKAVSFYVKLTIINFERLNLEKLFSSSFAYCLNLKNCLNNLFKVPFNILDNVVYKNL